MLPDHLGRTTIVVDAITEVGTIVITVDAITAETIENQEKTEKTIKFKFRRIEIPYSEGINDERIGGI
jgi:hypothetical protein